MKYKYIVFILLIFGNAVSACADGLSNGSNSPFHGTIFDKKIWNIDIPDKTLNKTKEELNLNFNDVDIPGNMSSEKKSDYRITRTPPLNHGRVAGEIVSGSLSSILFFAGGVALTPCGDGDGFACLGDKLLGGFIAAPIGSAVGTYLVGNTEKETGSFLKTLLSSTLGLVLGTALAVGTESEIGIALIPLSMGVGSTIGFNYSRAYKKPQKSKAIMFKVIDHKF